MTTTIDGLDVIDGETLLKTANTRLLRTGTTPVDELLSAGFDALHSRVTTPGGNQASRAAVARRGGLLPNVVHVISGPQRYLSGVLMRVAVMAQLPPANGGINARHVFYAEFNNHLDPYKLSRFAMERGLTPSRVLECIEVSRGFNWDQAVDIVARLLPLGIVDDSVVLVSGLTVGFDPTQTAHYEGLHAMIQGLKQCLRYKRVYVVLTAPVADGSTFKPRGGHNIAHFAGCMLSMSRPRPVSSGSTVHEWAMFKHPLYPERVLKCWNHAPAALARRKRGKGSDPATMHALEDFT